MAPKQVAAFEHPTDEQLVLLDIYRLFIATVELMALKRISFLLALKLSDAILQYRVNPSARWRSFIGVEFEARERSEPRQYPMRQWAPSRIEYTTLNVRLVFTKRCTCTTIQRCSEPIAGDKSQSTLHKNMRQSLMLREQHLQGTKYLDPELRFRKHIKPPEVTNHTQASRQLDS